MPKGSELEDVVFATTAADCWVAVAAASVEMSAVNIYRVGIGLQAWRPPQ